MARRWLLMLGSNLPDDARIREALLRLIEIGAPTVLTPVRKFPSHNGRGGEYYNVLAELVFDGDRATLDAALKQLEATLGRHRNGDRVAIDIDILAAHDGRDWRADAHALAKGEFRRPQLSALLRAGHRRQVLATPINEGKGMERFVVYLPRWLRWALLLALAALVIGFSVVFFLGINRPGYKDWLPASVSVVQIALTALAYVLVVFFTESGQSPAALQRRTAQVLIKLLPDTLARITDVHGASMVVSVGAASGVIGYDYTLRSANTQLRVWIGLNVHRVIVIVFCARPADVPDDAAFLRSLKEGFADTLGGALAVGYDEPHLQVETIGDCRFASIWLSWDIGSGEDFLTHSPSQLFFAQDVAMMLQSFVRTAQRRGWELSTALAPMPL